tara:strand:- start:271 stop:552 length:282 start_codon:yes stop_codon:yes gene_type:complete
MATNVVKRDGSKQPFDQEKLKRSIEAACQDAGLSPERTAQVTSQVLPIVLTTADSKEEITSSELKEAILAELDKVEASAAGAWRNYDQSKGGV